MKKVCAFLLALILTFQTPFLYASPLIGGINLPSPGEMVRMSPSVQPPLIRGVMIDPQKPLSFDFMLDSGLQSIGKSVIREESTRLINYFLASLSVPQSDLWVNLSPIEQERIIPENLNKTELGRDLLAQDYVLKQLAASLIYPEDKLGKTFWQKVYEQLIHGSV